jgi:hypothetical protein
MVPNLESADEEERKAGDCTCHEPWDLVSVSLFPFLSLKLAQ